MFERVNAISGKKLSKPIFALLVVSLCMLILIAPANAQEYSYLSAKDFEPNTFVQRQAISLLDSAFNFNTSAYTIGLNKDSNLTHYGLTEEETDFSFKSSQGSMRIVCSFVGNFLHQVYVSDIQGTISTKAKTNVLEATTGFLQRYQNLTSNPFYGTLNGMLNDIKLQENKTKISNNVLLEATFDDAERSNFVWTYVSDAGIEAPLKTIVVSYDHGQLQCFLDNWQLYSILGVPKLSAAEAQSTALDAVENLSYTITSDKNETITISGFKVANVGTPSLYYLNYMDHNLARDGKPLSLYPSWYVQVGFDKVYPGYVTGAIVRVWADNGEVSSVDPMIFEGPGDGPGQFSDESLNSGMEPTIIILSAVVCGMLTMFTSVPKYINSRLRKVPHWKFIVALLCVTVSLGSLFASFPSANATHMRSEVYASYYWQVDAERTYASALCGALTFNFSSAGYDVQNSCGIATTQTNMMTNIINDQTYFDEVAIFHFGHMNGYGTVFGSDGSTITWQNVADETSGNKHFFVMFWACHTAAKSYDDFGPDLFAHAWADNDYTNTNRDGYTYPNTSVPNCFIGFFGASPGLSFSIFKDSPVYGHEFIELFYSKALTEFYSVHDSLNLASLRLFGDTYQQSKLATGYETWWPGGGGQPEDWYNGSMKVYGNSNIKLHNLKLSVAAKDSYGNSISGVHFYVDDTYIGDSGSEEYPRWGSHTFRASVPAGYEFTSFTFSYEDGHTAYGYTNSYATHFTANCTLTANFRQLPTQYTIMASSDAHSTISPSGAVPVAAGGSQQFSMSANTGYHILGVFVDGVSQGSIPSYSFDDVRTEHTISVTSEINQYAITSSAGSGGSISPIGITNVNYGDSQSYSISPNAGYHITGVVVDGQSQGAIAYYEFTNVQATHTITASFAENQPNTFTIRPIAGIGGSISPGTEQTVNQGYNSPTFYFNPDSGYNVADVVIDSTTHLGAVSSYQFFNVQASHTIQATFEEDDPTTFTISPSAGSGGTINPSTPQTVEQGNNSPTFNITPNTGYHIADVVIDSTAHLGAVSSYQFTNVQAPHTIHASFAQDSTPLFHDGFESGNFNAWNPTGSPVTVTSPVLSGTYSANATGLQYWSKTLDSGQSDLFVAGYVMMPTILSNDESIFFLRTYDNSYINEVSAGLQIDNGNAYWVLRTYDGVDVWHTTATTIQANHWYFIETEYNANGIAKLWIDNNLITTVTGLSFSTNAQIMQAGNPWSEVPVGFISYGDDYTINTSFIGSEQVHFNLNISSNTGGSTVPSGNQQYVAGSNASVTAYPNGGYQLDHWELDSSNVGDSNPIIITMNSNHTLQAVFTTSSSYIFQDGFDSGNFNAWSGTSVTGGDTLQPVTSTKHDGSYGAHAVTSANGDNANVYYDLASALPTVYTKVYVNLAAFEGDSYPVLIWYHTSGGSNPIAFVRITPYGEGTATLDVADYATSQVYSSDPFTFSTNTWYSVELKATVGSSTGALQAWLNGESKIALSSLNMGTSNIGRISVGAAYSWGADNLYFDTVTIDDAYISGGQPSTYYTLSISSTAGGSTVPSGNQQYVAGSNASITAYPNGGYQFDHWELDSSNVGSSNPITVTMDGNHTLLAVFTSSTYIFQNGFDTGDFSVWSGTSITSGDTLEPVTSTKHDGSYGAHVVTSADGDNADVYYDLSSALSTVYTKMYVNYASFGGDSYPVLIWYHTAGGSNPIAFVRITPYGEGTATLDVADYATAQVYSSDPFAFSTNTWYSVELKATIGSSTGALQAWLNGESKISLSNLNMGTSNIGRIDVGAAYCWGADNLYFDTVTIDDAYI